MKKRMKKNIGNSKKISNINNSTILRVMKLSKDAIIPEYALESDVAFDLRANESVTLKPFEQKEIKTGIAIQIPEGYIGLIRDRAGVVTKMCVHAIAGTFSSSYRGEVTVFLINFADEPSYIEKEMRIAQMVIVPVNKVKIQEAKDLPKTERSERDIGSTGLKDIVKQLNKIAKKK